MAVAHAGRGNGERGRSASRCSTSRPASSPPPNITAPTACRRSPTSSRCSSRARSSSPARPATDRDPPPMVACAPAIPITPIDAWAFDAESARRTLLDQLRVGGLEGFGLDRQAGGRRGGRRARPLPAVDAEGRPRARPRDQLPPARRRAAHRSDDAQAPRDPRGLRGRTRRVAARRARSHRHRRSAAGCCAPGCCVRCCRSIAIRDRLDAVEELAFRTTDRGKFRDAIKTVQDLERLVARAALGTAGPRDLVGLKQSLAVIPRVRTVLAELQAPLVCSLVAELDDLADVRALHRADRSSTIRRRWRATAASSATASTPSSTSCGRSADPASRSSPRWRSASARAPASRR